MARVSPAFWKDQSVPVIVLQIIAFVSLIVALVFCASTIGVFGKQFKELKDNANKIGYTGDVCFLFADPNFFYLNGDNSYCEYIVYGQSLILITIIVLIAILLMTVFIRFTIGIDLILFVVISVISLLLSFIASVVLSNGFAKTCSRLSIKCSEFFNLYLTDDDVLQKLIAFTWIETMSMCVVVSVACVYLVLRLKNRGYRSI